MYCLGRQSLTRSVKMLLAFLVLDWLLADTTDATTRKYLVIVLRRKTSRMIRQQFSLYNLDEILQAKTSV